MTGDVYEQVARSLFEAHGVTPDQFAALTPRQVRALFGRPRRTFRSTNDAIRDYEARRVREDASSPG